MHLLVSFYLSVCPSISTDMPETVLNRGIQGMNESIQWLQHGYWIIMRVWSISFSTILSPQLNLRLFCGSVSCIIFLSWLHLFQVHTIWSPVQLVLSYNTTEAYEWQTVLLAKSKGTLFFNSTVLIYQAGIFERKLSKWSDSHYGSCPVLVYMPFMAKRWNGLKDTCYRWP